MTLEACQYVKTKKYSKRSKRKLLLQRNRYVTYIKAVFLIGNLSMRSWTATVRHGVTWKRKTKRLKHTGDLFRKNLQVKNVCQFYTYTHLDQRKVFCRRKIQESSCAKEETIDIDILVASRNGDGKITQFIRITSRPPSRITKRNQLSQFRWTSSKSNTYKKDLTWLHFDNAPKVQER